MSRADVSVPQIMAASVRAWKLSTIADEGECKGPHRDAARAHREVMRLAQHGGAQTMHASTDHAIAANRHSAIADGRAPACEPGNPLREAGAEKPEYVRAWEKLLVATVVWLCDSALCTDEAACTARVLDPQGGKIVATCRVCTEHLRHLRAAASARRPAFSVVTLDVEGKEPIEVPS